MQASDFNQKNIVGFMAWLKSDRDNVATTINHRLSDIRGFCRYLSPFRQFMLLLYYTMKLSMWHFSQKNRDCEYSAVSVVFPVLLLIGLLHCKTFQETLCVQQIGFLIDHVQIDVQLPLGFHPLDLGF